MRVVVLREWAILRPRVKSTSGRVRYRLIILSNGFILLFPLQQNIRYNGLIPQCIVHNKAFSKENYMCGSSQVLMKLSPELSERPFVLRDRMQLVLHQEYSVH